MEPYTYLGLGQAGPQLLDQWHCYSFKVLDFTSDAMPRLLSLAYLAHLLHTLRPRGVAMVNSVVN